ncbi:MAG: class I SAM-dependent methyltransferase [Phyllobacteriaceae bacterium]|nr:class I SAM-dependent methyltransferase [Phyllobacteriaceae bacterium]
MSMIEVINRRTWKNPLSVRYYRIHSGYVDEGEREVFEILRALPKRPRVLDIGVGGGRTTALFDEIADDYVGIDYTPEMVDLARANHPGLTFRNMDARDLGAFADASFDVAMFSFNGIDSVDHAGRLDVLREVSRVLAPGGLFVFSTFHSEWEGFRNRRYRRTILSANPFKIAARLVWYGLGMIRARRNRRHEHRGETHAILRHFAHDYGIMVHATTPAAIRSELSQAGFDAEVRIFDENGRPIDETSPLDHIQYFHVVCRKPAV